MNGMGDGESRSGRLKLYQTEKQPKSTEAVATSTYVCICMYISCNRAKSILASQPGNFMIYQLFTCPDDLKCYSSTHGCLTRFRNNLQQK